MDRIEDYSDSRQKSWCIHCADSLSNLEVNLDHVPTKSLLRKPRPHNLPVVAICSRCNNGFSRDEQYVVAFLSCVIAGNTDPAKQRNASAARSLAASPALRARIEGSKSTQEVPEGGIQANWTPESDRFERVVVKNARGHAYFEFGEPMLDPPARVWMKPLKTLGSDEREVFERSGQGELGYWPEVGSHMITRLLSGEDFENGWVILQRGNYRYAVDQYDDGIRVRSVIHEYLATEVQWMD